MADSSSRFPGVSSGLVATLLLVVLPTLGAQPASWDAATETTLSPPPGETLITNRPSRQAPPQFDGVRRRIEQLLVEEGLPSISVAVARDGQILWEEGFGWADREKRIPATEHTMYSLASITKPITATGLMVLVERGLMDLDQPVNEYLGDAKIQGRAGAASGATVRRLANHTSGLSAHDQRFYGSELDRLPPMDETIRRYGNLVSAPGERVHYSNLAYGILGYVISRVSGRSYADFLREEVFIPLGMTRSSVGIGPGLDAFQARRYGRGVGLLPAYETDTPGAADVYSSAHDLIRFAMFHLGDHLPDQKAVVSDEGLRHMREATGGDLPGGMYGVGWALDNEFGLPLSFGHGGGLPGANNSLRLFPEEDVAIVLLCNGDTREVGALRQMIQDAVLALPGDPDAGPANPPVQPGRREFEPGPEWVGTWSGDVYLPSGPMPVVLEIRPDGDLHMLVNDGRPPVDAAWVRALVNRARLGSDGFLKGYLSPGSRAAREDRWPYMRGIDLKRRGSVLNGALTVYDSSKYKDRADNLVHYWIELTKEN